MTPKHIAHARAKQILSPCVIAAQAAFLSSLAIALFVEPQTFDIANPHEGSIDVDPPPVQPRQSFLMKKAFSNRIERRKEG